MADSEDPNLLGSVVDLVEDAMLAEAHTDGVLFSAKLSITGRAWVFGERLESDDDAPEGLCGKLRSLSADGARKTLYIRRRVLFEEVVE